MGLLNFLKNKWSEAEATNAKERLEKLERDKRERDVLFEAAKFVKFDVFYEPCTSHMLFETQILYIRKVSADGPLGYKEVNEVRHLRGYLNKDGIPYGMILDHFGIKQKVFKSPRTFRLWAESILSAEQYVNLFHGKRQRLLEFKPLNDMDI